MKRPLFPYIATAVCGLCAAFALSTLFWMHPASAQTSLAPAPVLIGNGTADNTATIQAMVNALPWGGTLHFPAGNYRYTRPITVGAKVGIHLTGDSGRAGGQPYGPGESSLLSVLTGPGFIFDKTIDCDATDLVFSGSVDGSTVAPIGIQFRNSGGFGSTRNSVHHCSFWYCTDAIRIGEPTDANCDNFLVADSQFSFCLNALTITNAQSVCDRMERCVVVRSRSVLDLQQGGIVTLSGICTTACADVCPITAAHPKADLANDWMIRLGTAGPDNELVTVQDFFIDGGAASSQFIGTVGAGGHQIVVRDTHQSLTPNGNPLVNLINSSIIFDHSSFKGSNLGTLVASKVRVGWGSLVPAKVVADSKSSVSVEQ